MSRLSRQSSGRSDYGGPTLTVPVINNVLDAEVSAVTTAEVVENSRNLNVLQTPTFQVIDTKVKFSSCRSFFLLSSNIIYYRF